MYDYYFQCREDEYQDLLDFCANKGLIQVDKGEISVKGKGMWDYIGTTVKKDSGREVVDSDGVLTKADQVLETKGGGIMLSINLRTEYDITEEFGVELEKYCSFDGEGNMVAPVDRTRVFF